MIMSISTEEFKKLFMELTEENQIIIKDLLSDLVHRQTQEEKAWQD